MVNAIIKIIIHDNYVVMFTSVHVQLGIAEVYTDRQTNMWSYYCL